MKAAVLDPAAASKFSTAAAIASQQSLNSNRNVDWRDNTLASASPPRVLLPAREVGAAVGSPIASCWVPLRGQPCLIQIGIDK